MKKKNRSHIWMCLPLIYVVCPRWERCYTDTRPCFWGFGHLPLCSHQSGTLHLGIIVVLEVNLDEIIAAESRVPIPAPWFPVSRRLFKNAFHLLPVGALDCHSWVPEWDHEMVLCSLNWGMFAAAMEVIKTVCAKLPASRLYDSEIAVRMWRSL